MFTLQIYIDTADDLAKVGALAEFLINQADQPRNLNDVLFASLELLLLRMTDPSVLRKIEDNPDDYERWMSLKNKLRTAANQIETNMRD